MYDTVNGKPNYIGDVDAPLCEGCGDMPHPNFPCPGLDEPMWETEDGKLIPVVDLASDHLQNIERMLRERRKAATFDVLRAIDDEMRKRQLERLPVRSEARFKADRACAQIHRVLKDIEPQEKGVLVAELHRLIGLLNGLGPVVDEAIEKGLREAGDPLERLFKAAKKYKKWDKKKSRKKTKGSKRR